MNKLEEGACLTASGASETGSDWLTVITVRGKTISFTVYCKLSHNTWPASPATSLLSVFFFFYCLPLSPSVFLKISPAPLSHFPTVENWELTIGSQICVPAAPKGLQYDNAVVLKCHSGLFHPICCLHHLKTVLLLTQDLQGYLHIIYKKGSRFFLSLDTGMVTSVWCFLYMGFSTRCWVDKWL